MTAKKKQVLINDESVFSILTPAALVYLTILLVKKYCAVKY